MKEATKLYQTPELRCDRVIHIWIGRRGRTIDIDFRTAVILSRAKDLRWAQPGSLRSAQDDRGRAAPTSSR